MIIYNVTVKIEKDVHDEWLHWMQTKHIPDVMDTGIFREYRLTKVLVNEEDGATYSIQYLCDSTADLHKYQVNHAPALQAEHTEKYKDKFVAFRTLLEMVDSGTAK